MSERVDVQQLRDQIMARALIGIPGGFIEGVAECLPTDGDDWGYVLSESEFAALLARLDALEEVAEAAEQLMPFLDANATVPERGRARLINALIDVARLREGEA